MSIDIIHRASRVSASAPPVQPWLMERPPLLPGHESGADGLMMLVPMLGAGASMTLMMFFRGNGLAAVGAVTMMVTIMASVLMVCGQRGKATRRRHAQREAYLAYLERSRSALQEAETLRLTALRQAQPVTGSLLGLVRDRRRLWERRRGDEDCLRVRLGSGPVRSHEFCWHGEQDALQVADDFMQSEAEQVQRRFEDTPDAPVDLALTGGGSISVVGDREFCERVTRIVLSQATVFTSPEDLHVALATPPRRQHAWQWATWLPHLGDQRCVTPSGPRPRIAASVAQVRQLVADDLDGRVRAARAWRRDVAPHEPGPRGPWLLMVCDEYGAPSSDPLADVPHMRADDLQVIALHLVAVPEHEPPEVTVRIRQTGPGPDHAQIEHYIRREDQPQQRTVRLDDWAVAECTVLARSMAGLRLSPDSPEYEARDSDFNVRSALGIGESGTIDVDTSWASRQPHDFLHVPIGVDESGAPVLLDLKEAAQGGMGPHGLCVGATGSGKSELLRTLVLSLVSTHGPDDVAMVLVDFKGGATFAPFTSAPQVHGVITNLSDDAALIERVYASLAGEVRRRQEVLKDAGHLADITAYRRQRRERASAGLQQSPMPHLLVIIDEFGELLSARPDFIELFLSIGRIGRSIGVHLLLSSQRIEAGKLRGLETYLSYRIGLRTLSESESHTVLETPDAFALPSRPGFGYLKVDTSVYRKFRAGFVSGPVPLVPAESAGSADAVQLVPFYPDHTGIRDPPTDGATEGVDPGRSGPIVLEVVLAAISGRDRVGPPVWSAPLPDQLTLDQVRPSGVVATKSGVRIQRVQPLRLPVGWYDDPAHQHQGPWDVDLGEAGNVLIVGGPRSGRSTLLTSLVAAVALTHHCDEAIVYGIDALGSGLAGVDGLPVVAGVGIRMDAEVIRRAVEEVHAVMAEREALFRGHRWESLAAARAAHAGTYGKTATGGRSPRPEPMLADVVLVIDGFGPLNDEHPASQEMVNDLLRRGPAYGIHVVATVSRRHEVRLNQHGFFGEVIELRLSDPAESVAGKALAQTLWTAPPGRCLLASGVFAQVALPRIDAVADRASAADGLSRLVSRCADGATASATRIRVLPARVSIQDVVPASRAALIPLGVDEVSMQTAYADLDGADRHLLVVGDPGTGRTSILRHVAGTLIDQHSSDEVVLAVVDPRGAMRAEVPSDYLGGYAGSAASAQRLVEAMIVQLEQRASRLAEAVRGHPPPSPRIVLLVDDYDVLTAAGSSPLSALIPYAAMAREINLNVVLTRRTNGAARGVFEPTFAALRESGASAILLSGERSEGQLFNSVRPAPMPVGRGLLIRVGQPPRTVQTVCAEASPGVSRR